MKNKIFRIILILLLTFQVMPLKEAEAAWLSGYTYRKQLTITGSTGAGTGYQVKLLVGESAGVSGENFDVESHSVNFPNDITFTDDDGTTELKYWIEETTGTTPNRLSTFWVKVTDSLESNANIYCYYGKSSDNTNDSDGTNTFEFFDDFSGDLSKWDTYGTPSIDSGRLMLNAAPEGVSSLNTYSSGHALAGKIEVTTPNHDINLGFGITSIDSTSTGDTSEYAILIFYPNVGGNANKIWTQTRVDAGTRETYYQEAYGTGTYSWEVKWLSNDVDFTWAGPTSGTQDHNTIPDSAMYIRFYHWGTSPISYIDDIRVRKYISSEPSFSSAGSESTSEETIIRDATIRDATIR